MLLRFKIILLDWWRGFTNGDLVSALRKTEANKAPGGIAWLSKREMKALAAFYRDRY